ncbi:MAG: GNAT family N-acetyltransferase [Methanomassiliicoccus sp.]|nr:GNAT family N-acetyltransferase [Methanomassiliicoccus sp.]
MRDRLRLSTNSILYRPDRFDVLETLLGEIKKLDWSVLWAINMERSEPTGHFIERVRSTWNVIECDEKSNLVVPLPAAGDLSEMYDYNARRNYRKIVNRMEREKMEVRLEEITADGIDQAVDLYARQHIERWASKGGSYFRNPENVKFMKLATREACARHYGYAYQLRINGEVAAQVFGFQEGKRAYGERIGMDDRFGRYSPGWLISHRLLMTLRDQGVEEFELGWGGESYKYKMGGEERPLVGIGATRGIVSLAVRLVLQPRMQGVKDRLGIMSGKRDVKPAAQSIGPEHDQESIVQ